MRNLQELDFNQINHTNLLAYRKGVPWFIKGHRVYVAYDEDLSRIENEEKCKQYAQSLGYIGDFEDITFKIKELEKRIYKMNKRIAETRKFYRRWLKEEYTQKELLEFMQIKLGIKDPLSHFKDSNDYSFSNLDDETKKYLQDVINNPIREFHTNNVFNAFLVTRGKSKSRRDLNTTLSAYIFIYLENGGFIDGTQSNNITLYKFNDKFDDAVIDQRLKIAANTAKSKKGLINFFSVDWKDNTNLLKKLKGNSFSGKGVIVSLPEGTSLSDADLIKKTFRETFTDFKLDNQKKSIFQKALKKLQKIFDEQGTKIDLKGSILTAEDNNKIQMYWTKEEKDLAKEILTEANVKSPNKDSKQKPKNTDTTSNTKDSNSESITTDNTSKPKTKAKSFSKTSLGYQMKKHWGIHDPKYMNAQKARQGLKNDWNKEDAKTILKSFEDIMDNLNTDKTKFTKALRDQNLIEKKVKDLRKQLKEENENVLSMFNMKALENSVFMDKDTCLDCGYGEPELNAFLRREVFPSYLGYDEVEDATELFDRIGTPEALQYKKELYTALENAKWVDSEF